MSDSFAFNVPAPVALKDIFCARWPPFAVFEYVYTLDSRPVVLTQSEKIS